MTDSHNTKFTLRSHNERKSKILIGLAIVFVAVLVALFLARKQFVGGPGSPIVEGSGAVTDGGIKIPVKATFNEPKYMNLNSHPHPYGVFIGGKDMGTPNQTELYCIWKRKVYRARIWTRAVQNERTAG